MSDFNDDAESAFSELCAAKEDALIRSPLERLEDESWAISAAPAPDGEAADVEELRDSLKLLMRDMRRFGLLTPEQERALAQRVQQGDSNARLARIVQ